MNKTGHEDGHCPHSAAHTNSVPGVLILVLCSLVAGGTMASTIDTLPARHWLELPNTNLSQVYPDPWPGGTTGPQSVMKTWCGGAFDTKRDRLIIWCGGHNDYWGNEIYVFDVNQATWIRLTEPSSPTTQDYPHNPDGRPIARHTYDLLEYLPTVDAFVSFGGGSPGGVPNPSIDWFEFSKNEWTQKQDHPEFGGVIGRVSAWDPVTGHASVHGTYSPSKLAEYDPLNDTWVVHGSSRYLEIDGNAAIDPERRLMVLVGGYNPDVRQLYVWDLNNPDAPATSPSTTGDNTLEYARAVGFDYDPVIKKFVGWNGGGQVYTLDPDTWSWERIDPAPDNTVLPTAPEPNGTYSRFRYMPSKNAYILANRTTDNVFIYRLTDFVTLSPPQTPAAPTVTLSAP